MGLLWRKCVDKCGSWDLKRGDVWTLKITALKLIKYKILEDFNVYRMIEKLVQPSIFYYFTEEESMAVEQVMTVLTEDMEKGR